MYKYKNNDILRLSTNTKILNLYLICVKLHKEYLLLVDAFIDGKIAKTNLF